ncbi:hypothetical protein [Bradyrhizobium sp. 188]|uniref:hypothetical protein n=1 Tax=Bradyrhizobium sp. 188 TaxID=2782656 RepID=UPI001FF79C36|nr:hypothetical protein [Bradyrhizobium sp. 188]MCK1496089.1 hypothetical protein [Bradyrhizobium sp. 188]
MSKASRNRELKEVEIMLADEDIANEADYRSRGRRLEPLSDQDLEQRWLAYLRREFLEVAKHRIEGNDIAAEIALRHLAIHIPNDIVQAMQAEADRILSRNAPKSMH